MQLLQFVVLAGLRVVIDDGAVVDGHPTDIDTAERELRLRLGFRFFFRLVLLQVNQVLPVGDARFVLRQIQMQAIERDRIDLDLLIEQQRSEEHTSELQSLMRISYAVFCLKKKNYVQQLQYVYQ